MFLEKEKSFRKLVPSLSVLSLWPGAQIHATTIEMRRHLDGSRQAGAYDATLASSEPRAASI